MSEGWGGAPQIPLLRWKRGDLERLSRLYTSSYSWQMVDKGLETTSAWLNSILSLGHFRRSYPQRVSIFLHLSEPWSVFHHIHSGLTCWPWKRLAEDRDWCTCCLLSELTQTLVQGPSSLPTLAHIWQYCNVSESRSLHGAQTKTSLGLWGPLPPSMNLTTTGCPDQLCATPAPGAAYTFVWSNLGSWTPAWLSIMKYQTPNSCSLNTALLG